MPIIPTTTTTSVDPSYDEVCEAIKDVHDEASLWRLSDWLVRKAPAGVEAVEKVVAQAKARGIPTKSTNTMRLYRDVAIRFPASERVPLISFSAHREAIAVGDVKQAKQVLEDLAVKHGPAGVTVTTVKQAIGAATGKVSKATAAKVQSTYADIAIDLSKGAKAFIAGLDAMLDVKGVTLDGLHAGLSTVLTAVESRRSKAARRAAAKAPKAVNPASSAAAAKARAAANQASDRKAPVKPGAGKAGDLRDL